MTSCRLIRRHIDAHVDGELDARSELEIGAHLASCPHCRAEAAFTRMVKAETRAVVSAARAPDELRERILMALEQAPDPMSSTHRLEPVAAAGGSEEPRPSARGPRANETRWGTKTVRYVVPAAAAAVVFGALALRDRRASSADDASAAFDAAPVFEDVVRRHASDHPAEVRGDERAVSGWLRGKLDFHARPVVFGGESDAELVGARLSSVRDRDAAAFYYDVHGRRVTVMVFEPPRDLAVGAERVRVGDRDVYVRRVHGYTVPVVEQDGLTYAMTGDLDDQSLIRLAASAAPMP